MVDQAICPIVGDDIRQDTAVSRCEKLRRVLELEEWLNATRDIPMLVSACRRWQEERAQLLAELHL